MHPLDETAHILHLQRNIEADGDGKLQDRQARVTLQAFRPVRVLENVQILCFTFAEDGVMGSDVSIGVDRCTLGEKLLLLSLELFREKDEAL